MKKAYFYAGGAIFFWSTVATTCKLLSGTLNSLQLLWMNSLVAVGVDGAGAFSGKNRKSGKGKTGVIYGC